MKIFFLIILHMFSSATYANWEQQNVELFCKAEWNKINDKDKDKDKMYDYCFKKQMNDVQQLNDLEKLLRNKKWYNEVVKDKCYQEWKKNELIDYSMIRFCINKEKSAIENIENIFNRDTNSKKLAEACFNYWFRNNTADVFTMTLYCMKNKTVKPEAGSRLSELLAEINFFEKVWNKVLDYVETINTNKSKINKNKTDELEVEKKAKTEDHLNLVELSARIPTKLNLNEINSNGNYNIENVPLSIKKDELIKLQEECKVEKSESGIPLVESLTGHIPPLEILFPLSQGIYKGLSVYYGWVGGLNNQFAKTLKMNCGSERYTLAFLNNNDELFIYEKTLKLEAASPERALSSLTEHLKKRCSSNILTHNARSNDKSRNSVIDVIYCQSKSSLIVASIDNFYPPVNGEIYAKIAFVNGKRWQEYLKDYDNNELQKKNNNMNKLDDQI